MRKLTLTRLFALFLIPAGFLCLHGADSAPNARQRVELQLANGDHLSGEIIWRADNKIRFRSPLLGDFTLNEADVAVLEVADESTADSAKSPPASKPASPPPAPAAKPLAPAGTPAQATQPAPAQWRGKIEMGLVQQSGRVDSKSYNIRTEAEKSIRRHSLRGTGRLLYAEQSNKPSADRTEAAFRWRYQLSKRTFAQSQTLYYQDEITRIRLNLEQNIGLGYRLIDIPRHVLNLGGGLTGQYRDWEAGQNGIAPYAEVFQDYTFKINERISFIQDASFQYSPEDRAYSFSSNQLPIVPPDQDNYKIRFNSVLQGKISERISANLRFEYERDNAINNANARSLERLTSSIGYAF